MNGDRTQLRLVRDGDGALPERPCAKTPPILVESSRIRFVARQFARILVEELGEALAINGGTERPRERARSPVAGRIEHQTATIWALVDEWAEHLKAMRCTKGTIDAYRSHVRAAVRENGWSSPADLTYDAIVGHLQAAGETWQGTTYNRNLTIWRNLCKWLRARKLLDEDPLALASRRPDDGGPGSRAATTDEVRRLVAHAWAKAKVDKRASPFTPRYYAGMALAACRAEDQAPLPWRAYALDEPIPFIHWEPEFNKNGKRQYVAMAPELVDIMRAHREHCRVLGYPTGQDDPAWPKAVSPTTFRRYRKEIGVAELDAFGMRFSAHSFRKWLSTTLTNAGVPAKMVDVLMRHTGSVEARYYKPTLEEQRRALELMPRIWPEIIGSEKVSANSWTPTGNAHASKIILDSTPDRGDSHSSETVPQDQPRPTEAAFKRAPLPPTVSQRKRVKGALDSGLVGVGVGERTLVGSAGVIGSPETFDPGMPIPGSKIEVDRIALAETHELIARLLREGLGYGAGNERTG